MQSAEIEFSPRRTAMSSSDKRSFWWTSAVSPFIPGVCALLMVATGLHWIAAFPLIFYYGILILADAIVGEDPFNPREDEIAQIAVEPFYRNVLMWAIVSPYLSLFAVMGVVGLSDAPLWAKLLLVAGAGVGGGSSLIVGHELGHKSSKTSQMLAMFANSYAGYAHFKIEHNRGHHVQVATPEDSASSRFGESVYEFATREIPGAWRRGLHHERQRLERAGKPFWSVHNEILAGMVLTLSTGILLTVLFGWTVLPFLLLHHAISWQMLTITNYIEHYGLLRQKDANGRYEPCTPYHSWNSNHIVSNIALFHLQRHSDHHANPQRPYQALRNFDNLPSLPTGYPGCYMMAMFPPLWFKVMNRRALAWADGDMSRLNVKPGLAA